MATQKLQVIPTIKAGVLYGLKNIPSLLGTVVLYALTVWIPYLNVGTTIGLYKAVIKIGRGEVINPLDIFASENRRNLGDFFLLMGLLTIGTAAACSFMFIPGIVAGIGWGFAYYFFIDKGLSPVKALKVSWKSTQGEKWTILWVILVTVLAFTIVACVFVSLASIDYIGWLFGLIAAAVYLLMFAAIIAVEGVMYKHFSDKADEIFADKIAACGCSSAPAAPAAPAAEESVATDNTPAE